MVPLSSVTLAMCVFMLPCVTLGFGLLKTEIRISHSSPHSLTPHSSTMTEHWTYKQEITLLHVCPPFLFLHFVLLFCFYCLSLFPHWSPRRNVHIPSSTGPAPLGVHGWVQPARRFNGVQQHCTELTALNSLFWIGENYHRPIKLPDTTRLS